MNDMLEMKMMEVKSAEGNVDVFELQTPWSICMVQAAAVFLW